MISVRKGARFLLALALGLGAGCALAQRALAEGGGEPIVTRVGNTVNVTVTLTRTAYLSATPTIVESTGATHTAHWMNPTEQPITLTVLVDSVAGGGFIDAVNAAGAIDQLVKSMQASDVITIAVANRAKETDLAGFNWAPAGQAGEAFRDLRGILTFARLQSSESAISDKNFVNLLDLAETLKGPGQFVLILTNGFDVKQRPLQVAAMLLQLRTIDDKFLDANASGLLGQFDETHHVRIDDQALADKLKQQLAAVRPAMAWVSYTATAPGAVTATLQFDGARVDFRVPEAPPPVSTPAATATPKPVPLAVKATAAPQDEAAAASAESTAPAQFPIVPVLIGLGVVVVLAALAALAYWLWKRRDSGAYLLIGERRITLKQAQAIDARWWPGAGDDASYAHIEPYDKGGWVIAVEPGSTMTVDGLHSRRNRLRSGAQIALGPGNQFAMTFMDPGQARAPHKSQGSNAPKAKGQ